jgi:hypothetical protein
MNLYLRILISIAIASLLLCGNALAKPDSDPPPIEVDVNVVNQPLDVNVVPALPVFYRLERTVFGDDQSPDTDNTKRVAVTEWIILYDVSAETNTIRDLAGCTVSVSIQNSNMTGPFNELFQTFHFEKDVLVSRDGQITQQRLGRGVVVEPGNDIVIDGGGVTNPDIPMAGPNAFCSTTVQLYGELLEE